MMMQMTMFDAMTTQEDGTVSKRSQSRRENRQQHRERGESSRLILRALYDARRPLTRREICTALGREKTGWFIELLEQMVGDGLIARRVEWLRNGSPIYFYTADWNQRPDWYEALN